MSPSLTSEPVATQSPELATAIVTYLDRSVSARPQSASLTFVDDAVVVDDGKTYTGQAAIAGWLSATAAEFEYTTTRLSVGSDDAATTVVNRIEGNFPGRSVDLSYRFELNAESGLIQKLTISL
ncbi:nuclear transport factor 2 family protein [Cryobacterium melibiosiphilum]|uniref:Nuclear transport factor 2 family protein n=1 Tax=Cryobacterium melibiosiphilum TaxID=995039 RepID=A0A3A5MG85_9MICO|nr:nuclear transport factor 2 family protein [Cryobacterium melibiosiphilum]RJT86989.1 nuclear transport factor 2 family protein [Cryobacterium melibiosiphilum]